jgi:hypothetical protein
MSGSAGIGFRLHTGWAILVAISGDDEFRVLRRRRVELLPPGGRRFAYHDAAELPLADARELIDGVRAAAEAAALASIRSAIDDLQPARACIAGGGASIPDDLAAVLHSHARIHAAEGALYHEATASACRHLGLPVIAVREREVWSHASAAAGMTEAALKARIDAVRSLLGPPWTADHKLAAAVALVKA